MHPQYIILKQYILKLIDNGQWPTGHRLPSDNQLAVQFGISRITANRATRELTDAGILVRTAGVGTFVAEYIPQAPLFEVKNIADEIQSRGHHHSAKLHSLDREPASEDVAKEMEVAIDSIVFRSLLVHCENDIPIQVEDRYINPALVPLYIKQDFSTMTPNEYLIKVTPLTEVEHVVEAVLPDDRIQQLLSITADQPCLVIRRRTWSNHTIACFARLTYPGNRYHLGGRFAPDCTPTSYGRTHDR